MNIEKIFLDYPSNAYVRLFRDTFILYVHGNKIKSFTDYSDAYDYWYNKYCN